MKIFGQIEKAQFENLTSDPTGTGLVTGRAWYRTDTKTFKVYDGAAVQEFVDLATAQVLVSKTLTTPTINSAAIFGQITTPANPSAGNSKIYPKADGKFYTLDSTGAEVELGAGAGGVNYLANSTGDAGTVGWVTYADAAAAPVDMTGGSPTATFTQSGTTPLRGAGSFVFTRGTLGDGVAYTFTPAIADRGQVMKFAISYKVASGTFADGDLALYAYDVTNSQVIQPAPYKIMNAVGANKMTAAFQIPSTCASMRIGFHQVTTGSAYTVQLDDLTVAPVGSVVTTPVTDWISWTPTGGWSTNTTYTGQYRRVGGMAEFQVGVSLSGAPTGNLTINLPAGLVIDTAKIPNYGMSNQYVPDSVVAISDASAGSFSGMAQHSSSTALLMIVQGSTGSFVDVASAVNVTNPMTWATGDKLYASFSLPIVGWGSSLISSDAIDAGRTVAMRAVGSTTSTSSGGNVTIINPTKTFDTHGAYSTSTGIYTVAIAGKYKVFGMYQLSNAALTAGQFLQLQIAKNGTGVVVGQVVASGSATGYYAVNGSDEIDCVAGDAISLIIGCSITNAGFGSIFTVERISGPEQILPTPSPRSQVWLTAGNGHGSTNTKIRRFSTTVQNIGSAITYADSAASGASFTINEAGIYYVELEDFGSSAGTNFGASVNSAQLTTNIQSITNANRLCAVSTTNTVRGYVSAMYIAAIGDVIRPHDNGAGDETGDNWSLFRITKMNN